MIIYPLGAVQRIYEIPNQEVYIDFAGSVRIVISEIHTNRELPLPRAEAKVYVPGGRGTAAIRFLREGEAMALRMESIPSADEAFTTTIIMLDRATYTFLPDWFVKAVAGV